MEPGQRSDQEGTTKPKTVVPSHFRLGNKIGFYKEGSEDLQTGTISSISTAHADPGYKFMVPEYSLTEFLELRQIIPLVLTEEMLLSAGLKGHTKPASVFTFWDLDNSKGLTDMLCSYEGAIYIQKYNRRLDYYHEFQNFYFAVTGKEIAR